MTTLLLLIPTLGLLSSQGTLPAPTGPHPVGTEVFHLVDAARHDLLDPGRPRELLVQLWYPAQPAPERALAPYLIELSLPEAMVDGRYLDLGPDELEPWADLATHSLRAAPLVEQPAKLPLLLFSHGFGVARCSYTTLAEELASHGFVVAAIDHPHLGLMALPDGRVLSIAQDPRGEEAVVSRVEEMARDAGYVLDTLLDPAGACARFAARLDPERVGALGHSLGGAMALELGRSDARFRALCDLDGAPFGRVESEGLERPCLVLLNEPERSKRPPPAMGKERHDSWTAILTKHQTPAFLATIENTDHFSFSDIPWLVAAERRARSGATLPAVRTREIVCGLVRAFFDEYLGMASAGTFARAAQAWPEVGLESPGR